MLVETFECHETASEPIEASEEAVALIESLGLKGQKTLIGKDDASGRDTRLPYRQMTAEEAFVYGVLCPTEYPLDQYDRSPIPLRVLQIASHSQATGMFKRLVVWDRENVADKDPVLIGLRENAKWAWSEDRFILARWGEELEAFAVLRLRAATIWRERATEAVENIARRIQRDIAIVQAIPFSEMVEKGPTYVPTLNI